MQPKIETWQWVATGIVILVLIVIGVMVFSSPRDKTYGTTLEDRFQKCFDQGGSVYVPESLISSQKDLDNLKCFVDKSSSQSL